MEANNNSNYTIGKMLPVLMAFYVMGFGDIIGISTSYAQLELGLTNTLTQILTLMAFVWFALLSIPVGVFQDKKGKRNTVCIGILFFTASMLCPLLYYNYYGMIISFILLGIGNTIIQVSANPLMQDVSRSDKLSRNLTLSQFVKAIAGMLSPFIAASCAIYFHNWLYVYWYCLVICILTTFWLFNTKIEEKNTKGNASIKNSLELLKDKRVALLVLGTFVMVGFDVGMNTNIVKYLRNFFSISQENSSVGISLYFAALMIGRFFSTLFLNKVKGNIFLSISAILGFITFLLMFFPFSLVLAYTTIFLIGFFTSAIFPLIFSTGLQYKPERANELSGLFIMSVCGGGIIPPIMGVIEDWCGLRISLIILSLCLLYVVFLSIYIIKNGYHEASIRN